MRTTRRLERSALGLMALILSLGLVRDLPERPQRAAQTAQPTELSQPDGPPHLAALRLAPNANQSFMDRMYGAYR